MKTLFVVFAIILTSWTSYASQTNMKVLGYSPSSPSIPEQIKCTWCKVWAVAAADALGAYEGAAMGGKIGVFLGGPQGAVAGAVAGGIFIGVGASIAVGMAVAPPSTGVTPFTPQPSFVEWPVVAESGVIHNNLLYKALTNQGRGSIYEDWKEATIQNLGLTEEQITTVFPSEKNMEQLIVKYRSIREVKDIESILEAIETSNEEKTVILKTLNDVEKIQTYSAAKQHIKNMAKQHGILDSNCATNKENIKGCPQCCTRLQIFFSVLDYSLDFWYNQIN